MIVIVSIDVIIIIKSNFNIHQFIQFVLDGKFADAIRHLSRQHN